MLLLGDVINRHGFSFHRYADFTQLCLWHRANYDLFTVIDFRYQVIDAIKCPTSKPEKNRGLSHWSWNCYLHNITVKHVGVMFDSETGFISCIKNIQKWPFKDKPASGYLSLITELLMRAFISSHLDYCNDLFSGLPKESITNLQLLQNSVVQVLTRTREQQHITPVLKSSSALQDWF